MPIVLCAIFMLFIANTAPAQASLVEDVEMQELASRPRMRGTTWWEWVRDFLSYNPDYWYEKDKRKLIVSPTNVEETENSLTKPVVIILSVMIAGPATFYWLNNIVETKPLLIKDSLSKNKIDYNRGWENVLWKGNLYCLPKESYPPAKRPLLVPKQTVLYRELVLLNTLFPKAPVRANFSVFNNTESGVMTQSFSSHFLKKDWVLKNRDTWSELLLNLTLKAPVCLITENPALKKKTSLNKSIIRDEIITKKEDTHKKVILRGKPTVGSSLRKILKDFFSYIYNFLFSLSSSSQ